MNIYLVRHKTKRYDSWEDNTIISFTITLLIAENEEMIKNGWRKQKRNFI